MSIQSEITRIINARDDSFTQVAAKGVTVPAGVDIEDLPGLIAAIVQGGGVELPEPITAGDTPVMKNMTVTKVQKTSMTATECSLTIPKSGTYRFDWLAFTTGSTGTRQTRLYKNGAAVGTTLVLSAGTNIRACTLDLQCSEGDEVEVYALTSSTSYNVFAGALVASIEWDNGWSGGSGGSGDAGDSGGNENLISFAVNEDGTSVTYQAESGMTWTEWVGTSYNTKGYTVSENRVLFGNRYLLYNYSPITPTAAIVSGRTYALSN